MKKLMVMLLGVAFAACAWAGGGISVSVVPYSTIDTTPSSDNAGWYSFYVMSLDNVKVTSNSAVQSLDKDAYATWLGQNFSSAKESIIGGQNMVSMVGAFNSTNSKYANMTTSPTVSESVLVVSFFDDGKNMAYNVGYNEYSPAELRQIFNDSEEPSTGWIAVSSTENVPEPTSGLMILFGLAGLALKRKVA